MLTKIIVLQVISKIKYEINMKTQLENTTRKKTRENIKILKYSREHTGKKTTM